MRKLPTLLALFTIISAAAVHAKADAAAAPVLKLGSHGTETKDLQFRLQTLGFFDGPLTAKFATETRAAVKRFQQHYGLAADGIAGPRTWSKLKRLSVSRKELSMLARVIY